MARSVASAGDVNGDRLGDVILSDPYDDGRGFDSGEAYVVFGAPQPATIDLAQLGQRGSGSGVPPARTWPARP